MIAFAHVVIAGLAVFLVGANVAFLAHLGSRFVPWFTIKIVAVTLLLVYVATSVVWGSPDWWRLVIGLVAVVVDIYAIYRMWASIADAAEAGLVGPVPLFRQEVEAAAQDEKD